MGLFVKDGKWKYSFKLKGHKRIWGSTEVIFDNKASSKKLAIEIYFKHRNNYISGKELGYQSSISLVALFSKYLSTIQNTPTYHKSGIPALKTFRDFFKDSKAAQETTDGFENYRTWMREKRQRRVTGTTVNRYLGLLNTCYNWAIKKRELHIRVNPILEIKSYKSVTRNRVATFEEIKLLFSRFSQIMKDVLIFDAVTALRKGELRSLLWENVNLEKSYIRIRTNKEGNPYKTVVLHKDALTILYRLSNDKKGPYVFCTEDGKQLAEGGLIRTEFNRIKKELGIKNLTFHDLRHTSATRLVEESHDIYAASKLLGHSDIKITEKIYSHAGNEYLLKQVNKVPSYLGINDLFSMSKCGDSVVLKNWSNLYLEN